MVDPRYRRKGTGTRLLQWGVEHLTSCESVKLDATPAGRRVYLPLGFRDEYGLQRMTRPLQPGRSGEPGKHIRPMAEADLAAVLALDAPVFGADRERFLRAYFRLAPEFAYVARRGRSVEGFVLGRHGHSHERQ